VLYCTAHVDKAEKEDYECISGEVLPCGIPLPRGFDSAAMSLAMSSAMSSSLAPRSRTSHTPSSFTIQGQEDCTATICGTAPDGTTQALMINPKKCDEINECDDREDPFDDCIFELFFCAEESEIEATRLLTKYECDRDDDGDVICDD
jgi:hypothetical protein